MSRKNPPADGDGIEYEAEEDSNVVDSKLKRVKKQLKSCDKERAEYLAGWQRAKADLINYKKEQEQRIADYYKFANEGLILELLLVLDSFEEALKHIDAASPSAGEPRQGREGIQQLYNQLKNILKSNGLEEIESVGKKFDPSLHEAVAEGHPVRERGVGENIIIEEVQKGYKLNGKVIRPSRVKISK